MMKFLRVVVLFSLVFIITGCGEEEKNYTISAEDIVITEGDIVSVDSLVTLTLNGEVTIGDYVFTGIDNINTEGVYDVTVELVSDSTVKDQFTVTVLPDYEMTFVYDDKDSFAVGEEVLETDLFELKHNDTVLTDIGELSCATDVIDSEAICSYVVTVYGETVIDEAFTINIVDTVAPIISLSGDSDVIVEVNTTYSDEGAICSDNYDSECVVTFNNNVNINALGNYSVVYNANDSSGNDAVEVVRTVEVVDTVAPVISLSGDSDVIVEVNTTYSDEGAICSDNYDSECVVTFNNNVNINALGNYSVVYNANDSSGNDAVEVVRTVEVVDTTAPIITVLDKIEYTIGDGIPDFSTVLTVYDNYDGDLIDDITFDFEIGDYLSVGSYQLLISVIDSSGNSATEEVTIDVVLSTLLLTLEESELLDLIFSTSYEVPSSIVLTNIGDSPSIISQIDSLTGIGYLDDGESFDRIGVGAVTSSDYIYFVQAYNMSIETIAGNLALIGPYLSLIEEFDKEYQSGDLTMMMSKLDGSYVVTASMLIMDIEMNFEISFDLPVDDEPLILTIQSDVMGITYNHIITRDNVGIQSIEYSMSMEFDGGVVSQNSLLEIVDDEILYTMELITEVDEVIVSINQFVKHTDDYTAIYYDNYDIEGTRLQILDSEGILLFEYEDYMPTIPLIGTKKARWFISEMTGFDTVVFTDGGLFGSDKYTFDGVDYSGDFSLEAKTYSIGVLVDIDELDEESSDTWVVRIDGDIENDFDLLTTLPDLFTFTSTLDISTIVIEFLDDIPETFN